METIEKHRTNHAPVRGWVSTLMIVLGAIAAVATSPPYSAVEDEFEGLTFEMSATNPEVRIPFDFEISEAARTGNWSVRFDFEMVWRGVEASKAVLAGEVYGSNGSQVRSESGDSELHLSCRDECIGGGEVVLRLPEGFPGAVTVDWTAVAQASFDTDEPPEGAEIFLDIQDVPPAAVSQVIASGFLSAGEPERQIVDRSRIEITTTEPGNEYFFELVASSSRLPDKAFLYVITEAHTTRLSASGSVPVAPPDGCFTPCTWTFDVMLVDETARSHNEPYATWRLRQMNNLSPSDVEMASVRVPTLTAEATGEPIQIAGDGSASVDVAVTVDRRILDAAGVDEHPPHLLLNLEAVFDEAETAFPDRARFEHGFADLPFPPDGASPDHTFPLYDSTFNTGRLVQAPVILDCSTDECRADFRLVFSTEVFESGYVTFTWKLTASLPFPFAAGAPDATIEIETP